eukprot:6395527-Prymnesium_polylepis.1
MRRSGAPLVAVPAVRGAGGRLPLRTSLLAPPPSSCEHRSTAPTACVRNRPIGRVNPHPPPSLTLA